MMQKEQLNSRDTMIAFGALLYFALFAIMVAITVSKYLMARISCRAFIQRTNSLFSIPFCEQGILQFL